MLCMLLSSMRFLYSALKNISLFTTDTPTSIYSVSEYIDNRSSDSLPRLRILVDLVSAVGNMVSMIKSCPIIGGGRKSMIYSTCMYMYISYH